MQKRVCGKDCKDKHGNCPTLEENGLPVQCVGQWAEDKYYFLEQYFFASRAARKMFADKGNAVFLDLFSGPGLCIIKDEKRKIPSGGFRTLNIPEPFNEYYYFDIQKINIDSLKKRLNGYKNCSAMCGDANKLIINLVDKLKEKNYRYHFCFIDPFGPDGLQFETIRKLSELNRIDVLLHFPIGAIKRNLDSWGQKSYTVLDKFLGTNVWRDEIKKNPSHVYNILTDIYVKQLKTLGYIDSKLQLATSDSKIYPDLPAVPIKNTKNVDLYVLILISKHPLPRKIWASVIKTNRVGQKNLL